jgi:hypothetical protein
MIIKKKKGSKSVKMIEDDIRYGFRKIISQTLPIYFITITNMDIYSVEKLRYILTNKFFKQIHRDYKNSYDIINYLYIIEYPEKVSRGNMIPNNCYIHTHIIMGTSINTHHIRFYIENTFIKHNTLIKRIDKRSDKLNLENYFVKQKDNFKDTNYNYKITNSNYSKLI